MRTCDVLCGDLRRERSCTAASGTRLGGYKTEGTAVGVYDIRLLRDNPCTSSMEWLMQGLPVAHWQQGKRCPVGAGYDVGDRPWMGDPGSKPGMRSEDRILDEGTVRPVCEKGPKRTPEPKTDRPVCKNPQNRTPERSWMGDPGSGPGMRGK